MPLGPGRAGRGVIGAPVARTAAVAGTAAVAVTAIVAETTDGTIDRTTAGAMAITDAEVASAESL